MATSQGNGYGTQSIEALEGQQVRVVFSVLVVCLN